MNYVMWEFSFKKLQFRFKYVFLFFINLKQNKIMKKIKISLLCLFVSITLVSCDVDSMMNTLQTGVNMYGQIKDISSRGENPMVTKLKDVEFDVSRGESSAVMSNIEDLNYISYPGVDAKFRDQLLEKVKADVSASDYKKETCTDQQCVISYKDKGILVFNQKGDNLEAVAVKGKFTSAEIQEGIKSGAIFNLKQNIKTTR